MDTNHLERQLLAVNKSIQTLKDQTIPVPDELSNLKLNLINTHSEKKKLVDLKQSVKQRLEIMLNKIEPQVHTRSRTVPKRKSARQYPEKKKTFSVGLRDLIENGILSVGTKLFHQDRREIFRGTIKQYGKIEIDINGDSQVVDSLSTAVKALTGQSRNGWDWWYTKLENGQAVPLSYFRQQAEKEYRV
jgi:hypothetical protein